MKKQAVKKQDKNIKKPKKSVAPKKPALSAYEKGKRALGGKIC